MQKYCTHNIGHALGKSHHKTNSFISDPALLNGKVVCPNPTLTVRSKSNGTHHAFSFFLVSYTVHLLMN
ncbi:hypothetical protein P8452_26581 [Trifolium repens]|nr:hypothetical protein P8452_26581 [Trifolium repens]